MEIGEGPGVGTTVEKTELNPPNMRILNDLSCRLTMTGTVSLAEDTNLNPSWDSELWDDYALHSTSTNPARINGLWAGYYLVTGSFRFPDGGAGLRRVVVRNGTGTLLHQHDREVVLNETVDIQFACKVRLTQAMVDAGTNYIQLEVRHNTGGLGALNVGGVESFIDMTFLGG